MLNFELELKNTNMKFKIGLMLKLASLLISLNILFMSCIKDDGSVALKAVVQEYGTNLPLDSFQIYLRSEICSFLYAGPICINDTILISERDGLLHFDFEQCCSTELTDIGFINERAYAKRYDVEIVEASKLDTNKTCNGHIELNAARIYDFTITIKPKIDLKVQSKDTSYISFDLPEFNEFNISLFGMPENKFKTVYLKKLKGKLNIVLNKSDLSKVSIEKEYNALIESEIYVYHE